MKSTPLQHIPIAADQSASRIASETNQLSVQQPIPPKSLALRRLGKGRAQQDGAAPVDGAAPADGAAPIDDSTPADDSTPVDDSTPADDTTPVDDSTPDSATV